MEPVSRGRGIEKVKSKFRKPTSAHIGSPVTWMRKSKRRHSRGVQADVDVPCGDCNACCHGISVFLEPDEVEQYQCIEELDAEGRRVIRLKRGNDDSCIYLDEAGACSIYERRPRECRGFDCRPLAFCGIRVEQDSLNEGLQHWDMTPKSAQDREVLLALRLCRDLFEEFNLKADVASVLFFSMLEEARPLARATLKKDHAAIKQNEEMLLRRWSARANEARSMSRIGA